MEQLLIELNNLYRKVLSLGVNFPTIAGQKILNRAQAVLNTDASPLDLVKDDLGCAETVTNILRAVHPDVKIITGTWTLYSYLKTNSRYVPVLRPIGGDIIISPTGLGNGKLSNGHTGIMLDSIKVASSDSATGFFKQNYTVDTWKKRYATLGGFPVLFYRRII